MGFKQKFGKVAEVVNISDSSLGKGGDAFKQSYDEVLKVINTHYDGEGFDIITLLVKNIISMDEIQIEKFYNEVGKRSLSGDNNEVEFNELEKQLFDKTNKKEAVLEYIKTGTTSLTFANTLLTIVKTILSFAE